MDRKKATLNIIFGLITKITIMVIMLVSKSLLVRNLGSSVNGLFSLFIDISGFLTIAELGIGSAIIFSMYKPISIGDKDELSALYNLFKKIYRVIFFIVLGIGLVAIPFLSKFTNELPPDINIYYSYFVFLLSSSLSYLFSYKTSLIDAHKDNYITSLIYMITKVIEGVLQIVVLYITQSFFLFLFSKLIAVIVQYAFVTLVFNNKYKNKVNSNKELDAEVRSSLLTNTKAIFIERLGNKLITAFDGFIIAFFVSITVLGKYSNYVMIISSLSGLLVVFFSELTSVLGHAYIGKTPKEMYGLFKKFYIVNFIMATVFFVGYIFVIDDFIKIIFGQTELLIARTIAIIAINYYIDFSRQSLSLFKTASGLFHEDRFRTIIEGILNIILSVILVRFWDETGVLVGTIITRLLISYLYEPYLLFNKRFDIKPRKFYIIHYGNVAMFSAVAFISINFKISSYGSFNNFILNGLLSVLTSIIILTIIFVISKTFRKEVLTFVKNVIKRDKD